MGHGNLITDSNVLCHFLYLVYDFIYSDSAFQVHICLKFELSFFIWFIQIYIIIKDRCRDIRSDTLNLFSSSREQLIFNASLICEGDSSFTSKSISSSMSIGVIFLYLDLSPCGVSEGSGVRDPGVDLEWWCCTTNSRSRITSIWVHRDPEVGSGSAQIRSPFQSVHLVR